MNNIDKIRFYDDPRAQRIDGGEKCSVTNNIDILCNVLWYDKNKPIVHMRGASSGQIIVPVAEGLLQVHANTFDDYINVQ